MNVEFINPFLEAIRNVLSTMAQTQATPQKPILKKDKRAMGDVTGMIGMASEQTKGSMAVTFPEAVIAPIAGRMLGEEITALDETVADMVGEITNMVTGGAKRVLSEKGYMFDMAIPSMIVGKDHKVYHKTTGPVVLIPLDTEYGTFYLEVCFEQ